ncbi:DUF1611 domain-containing protein [Streptomyces sp. NPDC051217]|uniref:DUF1611 domain-containing protein n=1 Tax=Streptomyces sp. NPDC051217 TaxID=3365644 RepID=UPI00378A3452
MIKSEKIAIYVDSEFAWQDSKTTEGVLRYRGEHVVCIIDSRTSGQDPAAVLRAKLSARVPIVPDLAAALAYGPDTLLLGLEPMHSELPPKLREAVRTAVGHGLHVISGLHYFLGNDPELSALAAAKGVALWDVRKPPEGARSARYLPRRPGTNVVLTVGSDTYVGKMTTTLEMHRTAQLRGVGSEFVATGQIGIMIAHSGIPADAIRSDFLNGYMDEAVRSASERSDWVFVEGQAALNSPIATGLTLGLLHGALPDFMVLCHRVADSHVRHYDNCRIPPLTELVEMNETAVNWLHHGRSSRVVAISLNTAGLDDAEARKTIDRTGWETGLPVTDVVRFGAGPLLDALPGFPGGTRPGAGDQASQ